MKKKIVQLSLLSIVSMHRAKIQNFKTALKWNVNSLDEVSFAIVRQYHRYHIFHKTSKVFFVRYFISFIH